METSDKNIDERDLALKAKYPKILQNLGGDPSQTCMSWMHDGIAVDDGWIPLLEEIFKFCQFQHDNNGYPQLVASQIKEKFGSLRFYHYFEDCDSENAENGKKFHRTKDYLEGAIDFACYNSSKICEVCGKPGAIKGQRWVKALCDECEERLMK